jgi:hypothetical protein
MNLQAAYKIYWLHEGFVTNTAVWSVTSCILPDGVVILEICSKSYVVCYEIKINFLLRIWNIFLVLNLRRRIYSFVPNSSFLCYWLRNVKVYYKGPFRTPVPTADRFYCTGIRFIFIFKNLCLLQVFVYFYSLLGQIWPFTVLILIAVMYGGNITAHLCGSAQAVGYIGFAPYKLAVRSNLR